MQIKNNNNTVYRIMILSQIVFLLYCVCNECSMNAFETGAAAVKIKPAVVRYLWPWKEKRFHPLV